MWNITLLTSALTACIKQKSLPDNLDIPMAVIYIKSTVTGLMQTWLSQPDAFDLSETAERHCHLPQCADTCASFVETALNS